MKKIRNMAELAVWSGISRPTLSKYFDNPESVRKTTRDRIEQALDKVDYRPNFHAMSLNRRKPRTIGVVVPLIADPFYAETVRRIELRALTSGYWAIVLSSHGERELEANAIETLLTLNVAGAIVAPLGTIENQPLFDRLGAEIPLVFFDSRMEGDYAFVGTDNGKSVGLITEYLCRTGSPPCFVEMPKVNRNAFERREAYRETMERLGTEPVFISGAKSDWTFEEAGNVIARQALQDADGFPTSTVLCANDRLAFGVMAAACKAGLVVGRSESSDLRVAGHDDHPLSRYSCPALTTVAQDTAAMANEVTDVLFEAITSGTPPPTGRSRLLEATLQMRDSA